MAGHRRFEHRELELDGLVAAGHGADGLLLAQLGVLGSDRRRCGAGAHVRLRLRAKHRKGGAFGAAVELAELHPPHQRGVGARVVARGLRLRARDVGCQDLAQRVVRRAEIARHLHVGDIQRIADLVEAAGLAVLRQLVLDLQPRGGKEIAQGVFILQAVHAPPGGAALLGVALLIRRDHGLREFLEKHPHLLLRRLRLLFLRRHFAIAHTVMHLHPFRESLGALEVKLQRGKVQVSLFGVRVVALHAVLVQES